MVKTDQIQAYEYCGAGTIIVQYWMSSFLILKPRDAIPEYLEERVEYLTEWCVVIASLIRNTYSLYFRFEPHSFAHTGWLVVLGQIV